MACSEMINCYDRTRLAKNVQDFNQIVNKVFKTALALCMNFD